MREGGGDLGVWSDAQTQIIPHWREARREASGKRGRMFGRMMSTSLPQGLGRVWSQRGGAAERITEVLGERGRAGDWRLLDGRLLGQFGKGQLPL